MEEKKPAGLGVASMVLGIISLVFLCLPGIPFITSLIGLILGGVGLKKCKQGLAGGKGMAVSGVVMNIIALVIEVIYIILTILSLGASFAPVMLLPFLEYLE